MSFDVPMGFDSEFERELGLALCTDIKNMKMSVANSLCAGLVDQPILEAMPMSTSADSDGMNGSECIELILKLPSGLSLQVNFNDKRYHRQFSPGKDLLCRACGWHLGFRRIWDITAGLAVDSSMLAQAGFQVVALERNKYLALMLRHARQSLLSYQKKSISESEREDKSVESSIHFLERITFVWVESKDFLSKENKDRLDPEVIYYDPMYPAKNKTALPSKEMQILREINGVNEEDVEILKKAMALGVKRVVVKRPLKAKPILEKPKFQLSSKLVRYDIY